MRAAVLFQLDTVERLAQEPADGAQVKDAYSERDAPLVRVRHALEVLNARRNPIALIRVKGGSKRRQRPIILTVEEFEPVVATLHEPYRTMVQTAPCLGLRVSDIAALQ